MSRYCLVLVAGLAAAAPAVAGGTWADAMFDELSKDFGSVPRGPTLTHPFRVVNNTKSPVVISGIRVSCGCTSAVALKNTLQPGEETAVVAKMDTSRFIGVKSVTIYVQFSQPAFEEVRLWVQANARNDFALSSDTLALGQVKRGDTPSASTTVTFYGVQAQVTEAKGESNYIQTSVKPVKNEAGQTAYELTAKLRGDAPVGRWYTDVWLKTNSAEIPQIRVPLTVEIESALTVSPEAVTLGQVAVNGESERRIILRGAKPFKITEVKGADDQLVVRDSTEESKPVHVLTVKFKAGEPGNLSRKLKIITDLPEDGEVSVHVSAQVTK
jgi:Protein of unknown function (DUF1573)